MSVSITDQEKALLNLIAKGEATQGADPYTSLWPSSSEPGLVQMTLSEVQQFQRQRVANGFRSSACGRYQFIQTALSDCIQYLGCNPLAVRFTPDIQDALIIAKLKKQRKLDQWISGSIDTPAFMLELSKEFASFPVPYDVQRRGRTIFKGQSYYAGDGLNKANHDADSVYQSLEDIKAGGTGNVTTVDTGTTGQNGALPELGQSPRTQIARQAAGTGVGNVPGTGRPNSQPIPPDVLPPASTVFLYQPIDPLDDRYDFRTGKMVKDILQNGTDAAAANPHTETSIGESNVAGTNTGVVPQGTDPDLTDPRGRDQISTSDDGSSAAPAAPQTSDDFADTTSVPTTAEQDAALAILGNTPPALDTLLSTTAPCPEPVTTQRVSVGYGVGQVDPALASAATTAVTSLSESVTDVGDKLFSSTTNTSREYEVNGRKVSQAEYEAAQKQINLFRGGPT